MRQIMLAACGLAMAACADRSAEVDHPFYLMSVEDPREIALFRCPKGPRVGCAIDGLPGPYVTAAGASGRFIVVAQNAQPDGGGPTSYYYFERVPEERSGWGNNPERIVGPLDERAFARAKARLGLPDFTIRP